MRVSSLMSGPTTTPGSNPGPTRSARTASTKRGTNRSAMDRWTKIRLAQMHDWPPTRRYLIATAPSTAASRSASSKTTKGALPPSSKDTRLRECAAACMSCFPTSVEPVKASFRTSGCAAKASPIGRDLAPVTTLNTPAGSPASAAISASARAVSGVAEAGLRTTGQPAARAGAILRVTMVAGKFHGVMAATTPTGWWTTHSRLSRNGEGTRSPYVRRASSANQPK